MSFILILIILLCILILLIPILVIYFVGLWHLFKKFDSKGWEALVPFYNTWVLAEVSGVAWWYALIIIVSNLGVLSDSTLNSILYLTSIVANFFVFYNLSKKFHKDSGFAVLMTFFPFIMIPIMGFSSKYQFDKDVSVSANGPIGENDISNLYSNLNTNNTRNINNSTVNKYCQYCGNPININSKYCNNCGKEINN